MSEYENVDRLEQQVASQIKPLNEAVGRVFEGKVVPIPESSVSWISPLRAAEIKAGTGQELIAAPMFACGDKIYLVNELISRRIAERRGSPPPFNDPLIYVLQGLAHEMMHVGCSPKDNKVEAKAVALTCWEAIYQDMTDASTNDVPEETKGHYRQVNQELLDAGEAVLVRTHGVRLSLGAPKRPLYEFANQTDEDIVDLLAALVMTDYIGHKIGFRPDGGERTIRDMWLVNYVNRLSVKKEHVNPLYEELRKFLAPGARLREFSEAYFSGDFYEKYVPPLSEQERVYFCCHLVLDSTTEAVELLMRSGQRKKKPDRRI